MVCVRQEFGLDVQRGFWGSENTRTVAAGHANGIVFVEFVFINAAQFAIEKTKRL
jgi:hypothetical protein